MTKTQQMQLVARELELVDLDLDDLMDERKRLYQRRNALLKELEDLEDCAEADWFARD